MLFGADIGIDLGTASVLVTIKGKGIVLHEPSVVAIDKKTKGIIAVGEEAREMIGKTPTSITTVRPMREGVISDYATTEKMLRYFIKKCIGNGIMCKPRIAVCVPSAVTEVEKRAVEDATKQAGARQVFVIEEPIAAAIGAGIDISKPKGSMVVDIGGGTTDIAVISLSDTVVSHSIKVAGDNFDADIVRYMRKSHNMLIGEPTAESLKINIGTAYKNSTPAEMEVSGRNLITGLPKTVVVTSDELYNCMKETVDSIVSAVCHVLEQTPPELISDIIERGMVMTGGGSLLYGLDKVITEKTGVNAVMAEDALTCVVYGTGKYIEYMTSFKNREKIKEKRVKLKAKRQEKED